jgi:hypothetical protein
MWCARYFNPRYWAERFWAKVGGVSVQTQEIVRLDDVGITWSGIKSEVASFSSVDTEALSGAGIKTEVLV